ncbi:MAG: carboxymuconolactone decarboxylase family protein [Candidatus Heimdallarchaeota archaeon]|nr:carboxymuconolactone decarboxylase family protein [Candidatus Heimdallarchaeota archaeon]MCG3254085.1 carboxymuconolactone decarboxylase family protein [Candidatus Heimdallarchaeota archaeon]MCK4291215.1 carboxymuconolactone decarboxylase family protein [Candidatus Heimdallarchaeota archaeon]
MNKLDEFKHYREKMNEKILASDNKQIKRFFALDSRAYEEGALSVKVKELLGLVSSTVLRCNDCITYHIINCVKEGVTTEEFFEAMNVALIVGGSIIIPHLRKAVEVFEECLQLVEEGKELPV